jgi:hypothetical protein
MEPSKKYRRIVSYWPRGGGGAGSARAFLRDATTGTDSVDVLMAGDSNTAYGGWGWTDGFTHALITHTSAVDYATPILPTTAWDSAFYYGVDSTTGANSKINAAGTVINPAGSSSLGGTLAKGSTSGPGGLTSLMKRTTGTLQPVSSPFEYGYIASGDWDDSSLAVYLYEVPNKLSWVGSELRFRVVHGVGPGMGTIRLAARLEQAPFTTLGTQSIACAAASYAWQAGTLTISADATRTGKYAACYVCRNGISSSRLTGEVALGLMSVSRPIKGICVSSISHHGGASMDTVAANVSGGNSIVSNYLKEARLRQIASGGTGRVIVCIQGGINTGTNAWRVSAESFFATCTAEWQGLGYPDSDLAFLGFVSHQRDSTDGMATERASAAAMSAANAAYESFDMTTLITYSELNTGSGGTSYFANATSDRNHLTAAGYQEVSKRIIQALTA